MSSSIEQLTTGEIILAGIDIYKGAVAVKVLARDASENILLATGLTKPTDATAGFSKSCLFIKTDAATGTAGLYENIGTSTSCSFNQVGAITAGEITLATGSILVGTAGVGAALDAKAAGQILVGNGTTLVGLDAKTTGRLLIGNGTTLASVAMQGDATIIANGTLTIANDAVTEAKLDNNLLTKGLRAQPALAVDDYFVTTVAAKATAYTLAHSASSDSLCRNVTVTHATVDTTDTFTGGFTVVGTNYLNEAITDTIIVSADGVATGVYAFKTITSITSSGWVQGGATADNIKVGFGNKIGMPFACNSPSAFMMCTLGTAVIAAPTVTISSYVHLTTVDASSGTYDGSKYMVVIFSGV
jgi:hypothetical protein